MFFSMNIIPIYDTPERFAPGTVRPKRPGGDGVKVPSEGCDDGNTVSGDGCSSSCSIEIGASALSALFWGYPS